MKIGLVAFRYHAGVLQMYLELCAAAGVEVVLFTGAHILRDIGQFFGQDAVPVAQSILNTGMRDSEFLRLIAAESADLDALLFVELQFDTQADWRCFNEAPFQCPVYAGVHDIVLEPGLEPLPCWRLPARLAARLRKAAFARVERFIVHQPQMQARFSKRMAPRATCFLPAYFRDRAFRRAPRVEGDLLRIAIPGVYSFARRDYGSVLRAAARVLERGFRLQLTMVGYPHGPGHAEVVEQFQAFGQQHSDALSWSRAYMEEGTFRAALEASDLVLAPLVPPPPRWEGWLPGGSERRVYALDRHITAATYDAARFQLPILYPAFYMPPGERHPGALTYDAEEDLANQLAALAENREALAALTADAIRHAGNFLPERFVAAFNAFLAG